MIAEKYRNSDLDFLLDENGKKPVNPPGKSVSGYVEGKRILPADTPFPGFWSNSKTPYLKEPMDNMGPFSDIRHQAMMKGAQLGFTACAENVIAYWMDENPAPIMLISATDDLLLEWTNKRLEPLIDSCGFRDKIHAQVEKAKSRRTGDNTKSKEFAGGFLLMASAQSPAKLRSNSIRILIRDEIDGAPKYLITGEGNWLDVSEARTNAWDYRKKIFDISTPGVAHDSNINEAYELGDQRKYEIRCPHCKTAQFLEFGNDKSEHGLKGVFDEDGNVVDSYYSCINEACTEKIYNHHKAEFLKGKTEDILIDRNFSMFGAIGSTCIGAPDLETLTVEIGAQWVPTSKSYSKFYRSYHMNSLYSPVGMLSWTELFEKWVKAKRHPDGMRAFRNLQMGLPYVEQGERPDSKKVYALRSDYKAGRVPNYVLYLTCAIDVQRGSETDPKNPPRLELEVLGHGAGFRTASITYHSIHGEVIDPNDGAWGKLERWAMKGGLTYKRSDGRPFEVKLIFIDSNDHFSTDAVYKFCALWDKTFPIKGFGDLTKRKKEQGDTVTGSNYKRYRVARSGNRAGGVMFYEISTNYYKRHVYNNLKIERQDTGDQRPGFCDFPRDYPGKYFDMLTAEEQRTDGSFHAGGRRNEALDCRVYNMCAGDVYLDSMVADYKAEAKNQGASPVDLMEINHAYVLQDLKNTILPRIPQKIR